MPRRRKKQAQSTAALITLTLKALVALGSAVVLAIMAYYRWAAKIVNPKWRRTAYLSPIVLLVIGATIGSLSSPNPEPESAYLYSPEPTEVVEANSVEEPEVEPEPAETEPEPQPELYVEAQAAEPYVEPEAEPEPENIGISYAVGTCKELKARGLGPFYPGEANYNSKRDRDNDGIACE